MNRYHYLDPKPMEGHLLKYRHEDYVVGKISCRNTRIVVTFGRLVNQTFLNFEQVKEQYPLQPKYEKKVTFESVEDLWEDFKPL